MKVYALTHLTDTGSERLVGIYKSIEGAIGYILGWYEYNIQDAQEYGSKADVEEAIELRDEGKEYYQNPENIQKIKQHQMSFGYRFGLEQFELED